MGRPSRAVILQVPTGGWGQVVGRETAIVVYSRGWGGLRKRERDRRGEEASRRGGEAARMGEERSLGGDTNNVLDYN